MRVENQEVRVSIVACSHQMERKAFLKKKFENFFIQGILHVKLQLQV